MGFSFVLLKPAKRILYCALSLLIVRADTGVCPYSWLSTTLVRSLHFSFFTFHFSLRASRGLSANSLGDMPKWRWKRVEKCERFEKPTA